MKFVADERETWAGDSHALKMLDTCAGVAVLTANVTIAAISASVERESCVPAMTIEINSPEVEALILQRMKSGAFSSPEDVILHALRSSKPEALTGAALIAAMQASPHKDIEIEPSRGPAPVRDVSL
jgi:hypothetical protein